MGSIFKGRRTPRGMPPAVRKYLEEHDRALADTSTRLQRELKKILYDIKGLKGPSSTPGKIAVVIPGTEDPVELPPQATQSTFFPGPDRSPIVAVAAEGKWHVLEKSRSQG